MGVGAIMENLPKSKVRKRIADVRCPVVKGLPDDVYHILHHSFVHIIRLRRSIESADAQVDRSREAILESRELLMRLRRMTV